MAFKNKSSSSNELPSVYLTWRAKVSILLVYAIFYFVLVLNIPVFQAYFPGDGNLHFGMLCWSSTIFLGAIVRALLGRRFMWVTISLLFLAGIVLTMFRTNSIDLGLGPHSLLIGYFGYAKICDEVFKSEKLTFWLESQMTRLAIYTIALPIVLFQLHAIFLRPLTTLEKKSKDSQDKFAKIPPLVNLIALKSRKLASARSEILQGQGLTVAKLSNGVLKVSPTSCIVPDVPYKVSPFFDRTSALIWPEMIPPDSDLSQTIVLNKDGCLSERYHFDGKEKTWYGYPDQVWITPTHRFLFGGELYYPDGERVASLLAFDQTGNHTPRSNWKNIEKNIDLHILGLPVLGFNQDWGISFIWSKFYFFGRPEGMLALRSDGTVLWKQPIESTKSSIDPISYALTPSSDGKKIHLLTCMKAKDGMTITDRALLPTTTQESRERKFKLLAASRTPCDFSSLSELNGRIFGMMSFGSVFRISDNPEDDEAYVKKWQASISGGGSGWLFHDFSGKLNFLSDRQSSNPMKRDFYTWNDDGSLATAINVVTPQQKIQNLILIKGSDPLVLVRGIKKVESFQ